MYSEQRMSSFLQLGILFMLCGIGILLGSFISLFITGGYSDAPVQDLAKELLKSENANLSKLLQFISSVFLLGIPAIAFAFIAWKPPLLSIGFTKAISGKQVFLVILFVMAGLFVSGGLGSLNEMIPLSPGQTAYFKGLEDDYNKQVLALSSMKNINDYLMSLLILGLLPALFEEIFFRGCLQQIMVAIFKNAFVGILVTAIFFSAIHLSFYGFLPRLFLGLMLGFIFYYSKNIWLSIAAHFLNNAIAVTQMYALSRAGKLSTAAMDETFPVYYGIAGIAAVIAIFYVFKQESELVISMDNMKRYKKNEFTNI